MAVGGAYFNDSTVAAPRRDWPILALVAGWAVLVGTGLLALWHYGATPGESEAPPVAWPSRSQIARDSRPTLMVFVHPKCPCSRATLSELAKLAAVNQGRAAIHVVFMAPSGTDASWRENGLYTAARGIPGAIVHVDADRREAQLFGAKTSGSALLYAADGRLLFRGGLTAARGHEGDNPGCNAVETLLAGKEVSFHETPVFGCPLFESSRLINTSKTCSAP